VDAHGKCRKRHTLLLIVVINFVHISQNHEGRAFQDYEQIIILHLGIAFIISVFHYLVERFKTLRGSITAQITLGE